MISDQQTEILKAFLRSEKFTDEDLIDDLVDHLSCEIESLLENGNVTFEEALEVAKQKILPNEPIQVQKDLEFLTTKTQNIMIKKIAFIGGYLSIACLAISITFGVLTFYSQKKYEYSLGTIHPEFSSILDDLDRESAIEYFDEGKRLGYNKHMNSQINTSEDFFVIAIILALLTYLPFQFYHRYQKSHQELA